MTKEEAIKIISEIKKSAQLLTLVPMNDTTDVEALDMAISALSENRFDGMTNGEVIKTLFPNIETSEFAITIHATTKVECNGIKGGISYDFWKEWWNTPYQKGGE